MAGAPGSISVKEVGRNYSKAISADPRICSAELGIKLEMLTVY